MKRLAMAAAAALLALAGGAAAAEPPQVIANPNWLRRPAGADLAESYPEVARHLGIEGYAVISCLVTDIGQLTGCSVAAEAPRDLGFGAAALDLTKSFQMRPMIVEGRAVSGGTARIPIRFNLPARPKLATLGLAKPDVQPSALAFQLVDLGQEHDHFLARHEDTIRKLEVSGYPGVPAATVSAATAALREAAKARALEFREAMARAYADFFSDAELREIVAFVASSAGGLATLGHHEALEDFDDKIAVEFGRQLRLVAREEFCRARDCAGSSAAFLKERARVAGEGRAIADPAWVDQASREAIDAATPRMADLLGLEGWVRLECAATREGLLEECRTQFEHPAGLGFRAAAIDLTRHYRLHPTVISQGAAGELVSLWINFPVKDEPAAFRAPRPRSAKAVHLARQLVAQEPWTTWREREAQGLLRALANALPRSADPEVYADAVRALRTATARSHEAYVEQQSNTYAALFSERELARALEFFESSAGKALREKEEMIVARVGSTESQLGRAIAADARAAYCKTRDCTMTPRTTGAQPAAARAAPSTPKP